MVCVENGDVSLVVELGLCCLFLIIEEAWELVCGQVIRNGQLLSTAHQQSVLSNFFNVFFVK